jgi:hypothetical protein
MKYLKIILASFFLSLIVTNTYAAKGVATVYKITMTKLEMCDSTSTDSLCNNPVTIGTGTSPVIDIASTTAGASAASYGNLGLGKFGTTYTYFQITMKRAITIKGTAADGANTTCITAESGDSSTAAEGAADGGTPAEVTVYAGFVGDSGDGLTLRMNSVADANGGTPAVAGTVVDNSEFFQYRQILDRPLTLKAGVIPTVKIAFGTATALEAVGNMGNCTQNIAAQVGFIAGEPDVSITFE